jgi:Flp pilus assembly protein TadD
LYSGRSGSPQAAKVVTVTARARVFLLVALAAVVASGVVVIGVLATRSDVPSVKPRPGLPPLALDFGLRTDPEARALQQAAQEYTRGHRADRAAAEKIFARYHSLEADVGAALASWPSGTVKRLQTLAAQHPGSSLVALHLGFALYWSHRDQEAETAWRAAEKLQPDTPYSVRAGNVLHPRLAPYLPTFVPSFQAPRGIEVLPPALEVGALERASRHGGAHAKILYGVALQKLGRPVSAERQFAAAARASPNDPEARAAAAVGLFDKDNPSLAFSRLGPLVRVFPHAQTVRLHLGVLLLWIADVERARKELRLARSEGPHSPLGQVASQYLQALQGVGTR